MKNQYLIRLTVTTNNGPLLLYWSGVLHCFTFGICRDVFSGPELAEQFNLADAQARQVAGAHPFQLRYIELDPEKLEAAGQAIQESFRFQAADRE